MVNVTNGCVMSSCVKPKEQKEANPVVLLHGFDSTCLEWRYTLPLLEEAGLETWAIDILGWGFSDLEKLPSCDVASKRDHLYQLWSTYIKKPMVLVGPSLESAVAIDFSVNYPEAVDRLVLINPSVYTKGTGNLAKLPKTAAYVGIGRLHCLLPWWEDATVNFMISGGYNVIDQIEHVKHKTVVILGEDDHIVDNKLGVKGHGKNATWLKVLRLVLYVCYMLTVLSAGAGGAPPPAFLLNGPNLKCSSSRRLRIWAGCDFPDFLPKQVEKIKDPYARKLASRIERIPVNFSKGCIMSSCVKPKEQKEANPVVLLHGFDSTCLEWRYTLPLLEEAGLEAWAVDILGWGFSDLGRLPSCDVASKRDHLYQLWSTYIKRPMVLVGPSLGSAVAIDFSVHYPEAVDRLVLIDASVYVEGTGKLATLPKAVAYAGVYLLKSIPLRLYAASLAFNGLPLSTCIDWTKIGRLHCLLPWWEDATVNFMISGGYNVIDQIKHVKHKTLIIWGEDDQIIDYKLGVRLHCELPNATLRQIPKCGHIPHVQQPDIVSRLIAEFVQSDQSQTVKPDSVSAISAPVIAGTCTGRYLLQ